MIEELRKLLIEHEGSVKRDDGRHMPYYDSVGKLTIGYGRNFDDRGISEDEAQDLLTHDIDDVLVDIHANFPWFAGLTKNRQLVVASMVFNMGLSRFKGFRKTIAYIEAGDFVQASLEMLDSHWAAQVGRRSSELAAMMRAG